MIKEMRKYRVVQCPLCEYTTGIYWGEANARSALASHLCRKKHGLSRSDAKACALTASITTKEFECYVTQDQG